ncbi:hypothetical protein CP98_03714 [Sphingobium yanoikuyae]|uniref:DUF551 domain-containing protein n=1 Tax=Sphingobium yanoikuyae TaxID=13690 RepID=A0A084EGX3_SPHYA|nr:hypothetical protein [Sphingobium yanoikuyae]KEZ17215.1 hypothetical protein CP98_03714 [Sphingobium yanoikuyae]
MTDIIQELRGLIAEATPGPWEYLNTSGTIVQKIDRLTTYVIAEMQTSNETIDAALIVAAINHLPALLDRLEAAERGWQPIETAPRDGTWIVTAGGGADFGMPMKWNERGGAWECDAVMLEDWDNQAEGYSRPTHWRPLPDVPAIREVKP